ncbi:MAG: ECF transporter S component [Gudongella sp.]|nr:ECF transporter S component [Gudongella sp.]
MKTRKIVTSGLLIAIGLLLPMLFHSINLGGQIFLPMHIPVLIGGMILGPLYGSIVGLITPILSSFFTGMPLAFPMLPIMVFELGIYGLTAGYFSKIFPKRIFLPLLAAMIDGRITAGLVVFVLSRFFGSDLNPLIFLKGAIITGLPGIMIQLILIPPIIIGLRKSLSSSGQDLKS